MPTQYKLGKNLTGGGRPARSPKPSHWPIFAAALLAGAGGCATSPTDALVGPWKSDALNLRVTPDSTAVWANCSYGKIPGRLTVNEAGSFRATFDFTFVPGAAGLPPVTTRLLMEGRLDGNQLTITLDAMAAALPVTHILTRGEGMPYLPCP